MQPLRRSDSHVASGHQACGRVRDRIEGAATADEGHRTDTRERLSSDDGTYQYPAEARAYGFSEGFEESRSVPGAVVGRKRPRQPQGRER